MTTIDPIQYYATHSTGTDPGEHAALLRDLPTDLPALHQIVQNILIHDWKIRAHHPHLRHGDHITLHTMRDLLARVIEKDARPLTEERALENKLIVDCRHFAGVLVALLRHQGVPARVRCGFGVYLEEHAVQDHYVCEYWNAKENCWVLEDADVLLHDITRDQFIVAGQAWLDSRSGKDDPMRFACGDTWRGYEPIRMNVIKDLAPLNKHEEMSLTSWGLNNKPYADQTPDDFALLDAAAAHTLANNSGFTAMQAFYQSDARLSVPERVRELNYITDTWGERDAVR